MAFLQFPKQQYFRSLDTDTVTKFGYYIDPNGNELLTMMVTIYVNGLIVTPFQFRINIYGADDSVTPIFTSEWATLSAATLLDADTGLPYTQNWIGNIYVDFNYEPINPALRYYISTETLGYTRIGDTFYMGANLDWYSPVNNQLDGPDLAGIRIRPLGLRELTS